MFKVLQYVSRKQTALNNLIISRRTKARYLHVKKKTHTETKNTTTFSITAKGLENPDKSKTVLHYESRNMCVCGECWSKSSNQKIQPYTGDKSVKIIEVDEYDDADNYIKVKWDDGHEGLFAITDKGSYGNGVIDAPDEYLYKLSTRKNKYQAF